MATRTKLKTKKGERSATEKRASAPRFKWPRVVVRFKDGFNEERERKELSEQYGLVAFHPVFIFARAAVERLQTEARERWQKRQDGRHEDHRDEDHREERSDSRLYPLPDFLNYYFLYLGPGRSPADVVRELRKRESIAFAYEDEPTMNSGGSPSEEKCKQNSGHVDGQGGGVDARFAWKLPGGKGDGQFFVDVERGWTVEHIRLPTSRIHLLVGESQFWSRRHGTSVLGVVCGLHLKAGGCKGLAPHVVYAGLASPVPDPAAQVSLPPTRYVAATASEQNIYDAIAMGIEKLDELHKSSPLNGYGVLLIEQQTAQGLPVETYRKTLSVPAPTVPEGVQALIRLATQFFGITVVEAAGNAGENLDTHPDAQVLTEHDSGAILVASAQKAVISGAAGAHHARFYWSNFGSRVDCYAWGEGVMAPAWQPEDPGVLNECDDTFGNTSAAAAIIAGVALVAQGIRAHRGNAPLGATELRAILTDSLRGTPCAQAEWIGVMPDLRQISPML